jgi:flagellar biogenesis protein FliO
MENKKTKKGSFVIGKALGLILALLILGAAAWGIIRFIISSSG